MTWWNFLSHLFDGALPEIMAPVSISMMSGMLGQVGVGGDFDDARPGFLSAYLIL